MAQEVEWEATQEMAEVQGNGGDMGQKPDDGNGTGKAGDGGNMGTPPKKVNNYNKEGR